ncbi:MAG: GDYXXLXY domain-containing protein [Cyanobacteriota bacterium]
MNSESRSSSRPPLPAVPATPTPQHPLPPVFPPASPVARWRFGLALAIQAALILVIPLQAIYTQATGQTVILQTGPVDPYHPLRGYYVTLGYDISQPGELENLPGWRAFEAAAQQQRSRFAARPIYVILEAPEDAGSQPPKPWKPVAVSGDRPTNLPANQVALKGLYRNGWVNYGLERYYMPEAERLNINNRIAELQQANPDLPKFVMEAKVGTNGEAVLTRMWLNDQPYQF